MVIIIYRNKELQFNSLIEAKEYFSYLNGKLILPTEEKTNDPYSHIGYFEEW